MERRGEETAESAGREVIGLRAFQTHRTLWSIMAMKETSTPPADKTTLGSATIVSTVP